MGGELPLFPPFSPFLPFFPFITGAAPPKERGGEREEVTGWPENEEPFIPALAGRGRGEKQPDLGGRKGGQ